MKQKRANSEKGIYSGYVRARAEGGRAHVRAVTYAKGQLHMFIKKANLQLKCQRKSTGKKKSYPQIANKYTK